MLFKALWYDVEQNQLSNLLFRNLQFWGLEIYLTNRLIAQETALSSKTNKWKR